MTILRMMHIAGKKVLMPHACNKGMNQPAYLSICPDKMLFMSPTSKKLVGHIDFGCLSVSPFVMHSIRSRMCRVKPGLPRSQAPQLPIQVLTAISVAEPCKSQSLYQCHHKSRLPQGGCRSVIYTYAVIFLPHFSWLHPEVTHASLGNSYATH